MIWIDKGLLLYYKGIKSFTGGTFGFNGDDPFVNKQCGRVRNDSIFNDMEYHKKPYAINVYVHE